MSGNVITSQTLPKALIMDSTRWYEEGRGSQPDDWKRICRTQPSDSPTEQSMPWLGFGRMTTKNEAAMVDWDMPYQGIPETAVNLMYSLGFQYGILARKYDKTGRMLERLSKSLGKTGPETMRYMFWTLFVDAFTATRGDGVPLCSTSHPLTGSASTAANKPSIDVVLSEAAISDARITIRRLADANGSFMDVFPHTLIFEPANHDEAYRLMESDGRVGTANNDPNAIKGTSYFPGGCIETPYLTSPDDWFITTTENDDNGFVFNEVFPLSYRCEEATSFLLTRFISFFAGSFMCENWVSLYGSSGVA